MDSKLNDLTQKLYAEGLEKGRQESERLIEQARANAADIVRKAQAEAENVRREAAENAEELHRNTMTELNLAGQQMVGKLKSTIREMASARALAGGVSQAALDPAFVREVLVGAMQNWREGTPLKAMLPSEMSGKLDTEFAKTLNQPLELQFSDSVASGFRLSPWDGSYYIDFTDEAFTALLKEYLRPKVDEIIFND